MFFNEKSEFFCRLLLGSEGEAPHKVTWSDYMEAALSKAAPDCCFKHVSTYEVLMCTLITVPF